MPSDFHDVAHLLRRAGFGGTRLEVEAFALLDWPDLVDTILDTSLNPSPASNQPNLDRSVGDWSSRYTAMTHHWFERARTVPRPIQEKVTLFWHGLLCSALSKINEHYLMFDQVQLFRARGMGDIVGLYQAMAVQPAMLLYLDNDRNRKGSPNENFARELMELFLLGQGHYSEDDVQASARAWTGHGLNQWDVHPRRYVFDAGDHDGGVKTFMGVAANWDGPQIIDHILLGPKQRAAARFIATKMWGFFAYPNPDTAIVDELASALIAGGMRVDALLRAIFMHPEFLGPRSRNSLVRSPFEFVVAALRHTGLSAAEINPQWYVGEMGQQLYNPPNVSGWRQNGYWISSSAMWAKARFASNLRWRANELNDLFVDLPGLSPTQSVTGALETFGVFAPSERTRNSLLGFVDAERAVGGWAEPTGLSFLSMMTPEFQLA